MTRRRFWADDGAHVQSLGVNKEVNVRVYFYHYDAGKVDLVWGVNGWKAVPESYWTDNTVPNDKGSLQTEMNPMGNGRFFVDLRIPSGSKVDVGFSIREAADGFTTIRWVEGSLFNYTLVRTGRFNLSAKLFLWNIVQIARKARGKISGSQLNKFAGIQWRKTDYTRFIVLAETRTGSTMLWKLLKSHPSIEMRNELFNPENPSQEKQKRINATIKDPAKALTEFLDNHIYTDYDQTVKAAGFKYAYNHRFVGNWDVVWSYLQRTRVHIIHLKRRNLLDRYLSFALAMRSNHWVAKNPEANRLYDEPIEIDPADCIDNIR
jgi:hypothetical protein